MNMGSSFKDLDARISKVKTVRNLDERFSRYFVLKKQIYKINEKTHLPRPSLSSLIHTFLPLAPSVKQGDYSSDFFWHHSAPHVACGASWVPFAKVGLFLVITGGVSSLLGLG